jgi:hypothetical protein
MATTEEQKTKNRAKQRRWQERHRTEIEAARAPYYHAACRVVALVDGDGNTRWVEAVPVSGEARWHVAWRYREQIDTPLALWLRALPREPVERVVGCLWDGPTARRLTRFLADEAGTVLQERTGPGRRRKTWVARGNGRLDVFDSIADAARALGMRPDCGMSVVGKPLPGGGRIL